MRNSATGNPAGQSNQSAEVALAAACSTLFRTTLRATDTLCVALSGGLDSMVLLDAATRLRGSFGFKLIALHVNHQLSPNANHWAQFCQQECDSRDIRLSIATLRLERPKGASLEALAREARYAEFARVDADVVALAQHLDDQSETLLLQLLRGAGVRGLAAMAAVADCGKSKIIRPLLDLPRTLLERYASERGLRWIEDESNASLRFDRNFLRHSVLPQLDSRFPGYRKALARSARHYAEAQSLLRELGTLDLAGAISQNHLHCALLRGLSTERAKNALRIFLQRHDIDPPSSVHISEIVRQLRSARASSNMQINLSEHTLHRFRDELWIVKTQPTPIHSVVLEWDGEEELSLPALSGTLYFRRVKGAGLRASPGARFTVRLRQGHERFQPDCKRPHRCLKNLFQESGIPPWQRSRLPFIFSQDILVAIPGLGIACDHQAGADEEGWLVEWILRN